MKRKRVNEYRINGDGSATVFLNKGYEALLDVEDLKVVLPYVWHIKPRAHSKTMYAVAGTYINGKHAIIRMHRLIMNNPSGFQIDHRDNDGLNNRKQNLRVCSNAENNQNIGLSSRNSTGYKGVVFHKASRKFVAAIKAFGKRKHLGLYPTAEDAARAYDNAAINLHGEFARLNFPKAQTAGRNYR